MNLFRRTRIEDETLELVRARKRLEGALYYDPMTRELSFRPYLRHRDRKKDEMLCESASGWLKRSVKKYKIYASANRGMGPVRSAAELKRQAMELVEYLKSLNMADLELIDSI